MTVRKIIEQINYVKANIGPSKYAGKLQDYIVTIQNNSNDLVLLKEILGKAIIDYDQLNENDIPELLQKILVSQETPFTDGDYYDRLITLREQDHIEPTTIYGPLNEILSELQTKVNSNLTELDKLSNTIQPFLSRDFSELQQDDNAIFSIIFNNINSYSTLKTLSFELKNWDRGLFIYQQIISNETPKPFEIIEIVQGSIEVVLNVIFEVGEKLLDLFQTGFEVYGSYLAYKTIVHDNLVKA